MSYDLAVYLPESPTPEALIEYVRQLPGLTVDQSSSQDATGPATVLVVRGRHREYCFTIDGPQKVEPEDVPEEITACILGPNYLYEISAVGSSATSVPLSYTLREATRPRSPGRGARRPNRRNVAKVLRSQG